MADRFRRQVRVHRQTAVFEGGGKQTSRQLARTRLAAKDRRSPEFKERPCPQCKGDSGWICDCSDPSCNASCDICGGIGVD